MGKIFYLLFLTLAALAGCKKSSFEPFFEKSPEERLGDAISLVQTTLISAPNGWIATLPTTAGGGYGFYMDFSSDQKVLMYSDISDAAASASITSTYRVTTGLGALLAFDTYSYISILQDPNPAFGGAVGSGFSSDVEFNFVRTNGDSIIFVGRQFRNPLVMVKATAAQKAAYEEGGYETAIKKFSDFFSANTFPYIEIVSGSETLKAGISANFTNDITSGKRISFTGLLADGISTAFGSAKIAFKLDAIDLLDKGIVYEGITFVKIAWKDATTLAIYDSAGKEYIIKDNPTPLTPLNLLFGYPNNFSYRSLSMPTGGLPTDVTSGFNSVYAETQNNFLAVDRPINLISFTLINNTTLQVYVSYNLGTKTYVTRADYTYSISDDVITFSDVTYNSGWNTRASQLKPLSDYMLSGPFRIDWVSSSNAGAPLMGGLYRVDDPSSFIYGIL